MGPFLLTSVLDNRPPPVEQPHVWANISLGRQRNYKKTIVISIAFIVKTRGAERTCPSSTTGVPSKEQVEQSVIFGGLRDAIPAR